jgi:hypothetical protein
LRSRPIPVREPPVASWRSPASSEILAGGTQVICLLALSDSGAPIYDDRHAASLAKMGVPAVACTPDLVPDLMATAIPRQDIALARSDGREGAYR